jgi:DNA-binding FadR family transcriptional regulator
MYTLKVAQAEQYQDIEQNETRLRVPFMVYRAIVDAEGNPVLDGQGQPTQELVEERNESFPISSTVEEVRETLQRHLTVIEEDWTRHEANKERDAQLTQSQEVAAAISGITL